MAQKNKKMNKNKSKSKKPVVKKKPAPAAPAAKKTGIIPLGDRVLVKPFTEAEVAEKKNDFGIILPDTVTKEKSAQGKVVAVGEGKYVDGKLTPVRVNIGDRVFFSKYSYDEVEYGGEEFYLLKEENILAIIK